MLSGPGRPVTSTIVLNGASSAGKSSLARALQDRFARPLVATGIDTWISAWPERFTAFPGEDGSPAAASSGLRIVPGRGAAPSWIVEFGADAHRLLHLAHRCWAAFAEAGQDQVIDHVLLDDQLKTDAAEMLHDAFWVALRCDLDVLVTREAARGDRHVGFASGTKAIVHDGVRYDLVLDSTTRSASELADELLGALGTWSPGHGTGARFERSRPSMVP